MSSRNNSEHLSSNPTLAAIQRAKTAQRASMEAARKSLDVNQLSSSPSASSPIAVGSPAKPSMLGSRKSQEMPIVGSPANKGPVNVFGVDDGHVEKGWWAATDQGHLNTATTATKPGEAKSAYVPDSAAAITAKPKLDFSSMFNQDKPAEETGAQ